MHLTFLSHLARHVRKVIEEVRVIKEFIWHSHFLDGIMMCFRMCKQLFSALLVIWFSCSDGKFMKAGGVLHELPAKENMLARRVLRLQLP